MELFFSHFFLLLRFAAECYVADYIFSFTLKRRKNFARRLALSIAGIFCLLILMAAVCTVTASTDFQFSQILCFSLILAPLNLAWLTFCFKDSMWNIVFCAMFGLLTKLGVISIIESIKYAIPKGSLFSFFEQDTAIGLFLQYMVILILYALVYVILGRDYERSDNFVRCGKQVIPLYLFTFLVITLLSIIKIPLEELDEIYCLLLEFSKATVCFLVCGMQFSLSREMIANEKKDIVDTLFIESQKQYEILKENIDIINLKCHDMRHQLQALKNGNMNTAYLNELEKAIDIYDSTIKTGNDVLDIILTDKSLRCSANQIDFTCIADGKKISFMQESDINSLFGNALENAMEYVSDIADTDKRFISLQVKDQANVLSIRVENYWDGEPIKWRNGLPVTTKGAAHSHGFGMLSMQRIVDKYGGDFQVKAEDNLFRVLIVIPLK